MTARDQSSPPLPSPPTVVVVTVTYGDRGDLLTRCIRAAFHSGANAAVVVNNGLDPVVRARHRSRIAACAAGPVHWVDLESNMGSAGGFSSGIARALTLDPSHIWILDDDNVAEPGALNEAMRALRDLEEESGVGGSAVSCFRPGLDQHRKLAEGQPPREVFARSGSVHVIDVKQRIAQKFRMHGSSSANQPAGSGRAASPTLAPKGVSIPLPYAPYGGLLLRPQTVREYGLPKLDYVLYYDDWFYTASLVRAGVEIWLVPAAVVVDVETTTPIARYDESNRWTERLLQTPANRQSIAFYTARNGVIFGWNQCESVEDKLWFVANLLLFVAVISGFAATNVNNRQSYKTVIIGIWEGLRGRTGYSRQLP